MLSPHHSTIFAHLCESFNLSKGKSSAVLRNQWNKARGWGFVLLLLMVRVMWWSMEKIFLRRPRRSLAPLLIPSWTLHDWSEDCHDTIPSTVRMVDTWRHRGRIIHRSGSASRYMLFGVGAWRLFRWDGLVDACICYGAGRRLPWWLRIFFCDGGGARGGATYHFPLSIFSRYLCSLSCFPPYLSQFPAIMYHFPPQYITSRHFAERKNCKIWWLVPIPL